MTKKNEFEELCDKLSEEKINSVSFVREQLQKRYGNNTDMLLQIKAEAQADDYMQYLAMRISLLALIVSFFCTTINFIPDTGSILIDCHSCAEVFI